MRAAWSRPGWSRQPVRLRAAGRFAPPTGPLAGHSVTRQQALLELAAEQAVRCVRHATEEAMALRDTTAHKAREAVMASVMAPRRSPARPDRPPTSREHMRALGATWQLQAVLRFNAQQAHAARREHRLLEHEVVEAVLGSMISRRPDAAAREVRADLDAGPAGAPTGQGAGDGVRCRVADAVMATKPVSTVASPRADCVIWSNDSTTRHREQQLLQGRARRGAGRSRGGRRRRARRRCWRSRWTACCCPRRGRPGCRSDGRSDGPGLGRGPTPRWSPR